MSLKGFHVLFITASILLACGMGAWCLRHYARQEGGVYLGAALAAFVAAAALVAYEAWFLKKARRLS